MALFTIDPVDNDLYADVVGGGAPVAGDDIEITKGYNEYTTGLGFTSNNWGAVLVGQFFQGMIGGKGNPWTLQANTAGKMVQLLGGRALYLSTSTSTIARLVVDMADPSAVVALSGAAGGAIGDCFCNGGAIEVADSVAAITNLYVGKGGRPKIRGSGSAAAIGSLFVRTGGSATLERDVGGMTVGCGGELLVANTRVTPSGDVTVGGRLKVREMGAMGVGTTLTLNEGCVLDLTESLSAISLIDLVLGDHCTILQRFGGPGYTVSGTTTTRGRGALVEKVTR